MVAASDAWRFAPTARREPTGYPRFSLPGGVPATVRNVALARIHYRARMRLDLYTSPKPGIVA